MDCICIFMSSIFKFINNSTYLCFSLKSSSSETFDFIGKLIELFPTPREKPNKNKLREALGSIVGALLEAYEKHPQHRLYRRCGSGDFTGAVVSYRSFTHAINGLKALSLIDWQEGYFPTSRDDPSKARAFNFRAEPQLIEFANDFGITPFNWNDHFKARPRPAKIAHPVILKTGSEWKCKGKSWEMEKVKGQVISFDPSDPLAASKIKQVDEINEFFAKADIQPAQLHLGFRRIFSKGNDPKFKWNKGGRLYSVHGGYQQQNGSERAKMTINGEKVCEVDIKASHLTIYHALLGKPLDLSNHPYEVPGIPRVIVKQFVTATLGKGKLPSQWPDEHKEAYLEAHPEKGLQKDYPIGKTSESILKTLPMLAEIHNSPWSWADFQFFEAEAIINSVHELALKHGVPALPVHDSLIVAISKVELAKKVLSEMFLKSVGVRPELSVKGL